MNYVEARIAKQVIADLVHAGFSVTVNDGEENTDVVRSTNQAAIFRAMGTTDEEYLIAYDAAGKRVGFVWLIYGNGCDLISDYTDKPEIEAALVRATALSNSL